MQIQYDTGPDAIWIDLSKEMQQHLIAYAEEVGRRIQKKDPELAYCWTHYGIFFEDLSPSIRWSSEDDAPGQFDDALVIGVVPLTPTEPSDG